MPLLTRTQRHKIISVLGSSEVRDIEQKYNEPARLWSNENWVTAACLRCTEPRCMKFSNEEICCEYLQDFSHERDLGVCPFDAIKWNFNKELPEIDNKRCIACGLCAARCPIGAIYKTENQMQIAEPSADYIDVPLDSENLKQHKLFIKELDRIYWKRQFQQENDEIMDFIYNEISKFDGRSKVPKILVRNLMIALNNECAISRTGDIYTRMDAIYSNNLTPACKGVIEIEFGKDTLEAARGILEDIAVMQSRNGLDKKDNAAIVVCLSFPNKRQGYFQVIKDIKRVLDLKIQTISLGALFLLIWNGIPVNFQAREFYVDFDSLSIRNIIEFKMGRHVNISEGKLGILEPEK